MYGYDTKTINGIGERYRTRSQIREAETMYTIIPVQVIAKAPLSEITPEGSSLREVRGFLLSISLSIILLRPSAAVLAPAPASRIRISRFTFGNPSAAINAPDNIKGSEKSVCSNFTKFPYVLRFLIFERILPDLGLLVRI